MIEILIRRMKEDDFKIMAKWLSTQDMLEFYGNVDWPFTLEMVIQKYKLELME